MNTFNKPNEFDESGAANAELINFQALELTAEIINQTLELPAAELDQIKSFIDQYGAPALTLFVSLLGILFINKGSSQYGKLSTSGSEKEKQRLAQGASGNVLTGVTLMGLTTVVGGNKLFLIPQVSVFIAAFEKYLKTRNVTMVGQISDEIRTNLMKIGFPLLALANAAITTSISAKNVWDALIPLGLNTLAVAITLGDEQKLAKLYRSLSILAGTTLVAGSAHSAYQAYGESDQGLIMSLAFLGLNGHFLMNEIREVVKAMKVPEGVAEEVEVERKL